MISFFICVAIYGFVLPYCGYCIVQRRIKRIGALRIIIRTRRDTHRLHQAMNSVWMDEKNILYVLAECVNPMGVIWNYNIFYGINLIDELRNELTMESFDKIKKLIPMR